MQHATSGGPVLVARVVGWLLVAAGAALAIAARWRTTAPAVGAADGPLLALWHSAAVEGATEVAADDDDMQTDFQDGDSPTGGSTSENVLGEAAKEDPITSSMSESDQMRMAVINEVRRQFHRTVAPLDAQADGAPELTRSALFIIRMIRVIGQKGEHLVELQDLPQDTWTTEQSLEYFLLPSSAKLRALLANETSRAADLFFRQNVLSARKQIKETMNPTLLSAGNVALPFLLPVQSGLPRPVLVKPDALLDAVAPELAADEQEYVYAMEQLAREVYGADVADFLAGRTTSNPSAFVQQVISTIGSTLTAGTSELSNVLKPDFLSGLQKRMRETEVGELAAAIRSLDEIDRKVLQDWISEVLEKGWQNLLRRVAHLGRN